MVCFLKNNMIMTPLMTVYIVSGAIVFVGIICLLIYDYVIKPGITKED